jgi:hypothetical protein
MFIVYFTKYVIEMIESNECRSNACEVSKLLLALMSSRRSRLCETLEYTSTRICR